MTLDDDTVWRDIVLGDTMRRDMFCDTLVDSFMIGRGSECCVLLGINMNSYEDAN